MRDLFFFFFALCYYWTASRQLLPLPPASVNGGSSRPRSMGILPLELGGSAVITQCCSIKNGASCSWSTAWVGPNEVEGYNTIRGVNGRGGTLCWINGRNGWCPLGANLPVFTGSRLLHLIVLCPLRKMWQCWVGQLLLTLTSWAQALFRERRWIRVMPLSLWIVSLLAASSCHLQ